MHREARQAEAVAAFKANPTEEAALALNSAAEAGEGGEEEEYGCWQLASTNRDAKASTYALLTTSRTVSGHLGHGILQKTKRLVVSICFVYPFQNGQHCKHCIRIQIEQIGKRCTFVNAVRACL